MKNNDTFKIPMIKLLNSKLASSAMVLKAMGTPILK
jgi:hypothetical protein